jgi:hypothetical protein
MYPITNSQAVASAAASLILFSATLFAGYALAAEGGVVPMPPPAAAKTANATSTPSPAVMDRAEQRITSLHDRLKITPAQEALWSKVADTMRSNDRAVDALAKARHDNAAKMTATEDLRSYGEITEAHAAGIRAFAPVFGNLYDSMTESQKTNADNVFRSEGRKTHKRAA